MADATDLWDLSRLSPYERQAWNEIRQWEATAGRRSLVPAKARTKAKELGHGAADVWRGIPFTSVIDTVLERIVEGGNEALTDAVVASLQRERILEAVRRAGSPVESLSDIRGLDMQVIDEVCPSLNLRYASLSAATGAGSGFVAAGGFAAAVGTAGVAATPGALAVTSALAADVVATIGLAARVVAHYAGYYGHDARNEEERAVILAVISLGVAGEGATKQAALLHVRQVAMMVARRAAWEELGEEAIVKLIQGLFAKLSVNLTKRKLAQTLPVVGIGIGAGFNYAFMRRVGTAASFAYRERFLIEKYGLDDSLPTPDLSQIIDVKVLEEGDESSES